MIPTICARSSIPPFFRQTVISLGGKRIARFVAALLAICTCLPESQAGSVRVDIYSTYDPDNAPSGGPYSGLAGHLDLSSDVFTGLGYSFGNPFGLSSFAA